MVSMKLLLRCVIVILAVLLGVLYASNTIRSLRNEINFIAGYRRTYDFSVNYFAANADNWRSYLKDYRGKSDIQYLEIGVFEGSSFVWILENILTHPSAKATAIDPFFDDGEEKFRNNLRTSGYQDKVKVIRAFSYDELPKLARNSFDIIYIDADHRAKSVYLDAALSWSLLKIGGLLIFDDYLLNLQYPADMRPKTAIDAFVTAFGDELDVIHNSYQLVIKKNTVRCPMQYCSAVGAYGYVWPERRMYDLTSGKQVSLTAMETATIENFIRIYTEQRQDRREALKVISSNQDMAQINERLKILQ
jgi:hypothetical protein